LHSNASSNVFADAPWMIHLSDDSKTIIDEKSKEIARALGNPISNLMGVSQPYYYTKSVDFDRDGNGYIDDEYYGVLFGAKSVGVPAIIIEHSFHTNKKAADWLLDDVNLERLAEVEADALAKYYGVDDKMDERIEKLEKRIKELENQVKPKWAYIDGNLEKDMPWAVDTMRKLVRKGMMKGNDNNSFEMSYLFMRIMVMLDRAGMFGE
jgi:tetrahydromethanopterin S-methyltransferase subunit B